MSETKLQSLVEIFNQRFFRIPDFQRGYAWQEEHLTDFWDDLLNIKPNKFHYTGLLTVETIIKTDVVKFEKWQDDLWMFEKGFKANYLIDGQQRLTTVIILLKVILDEFDNNDGINFQNKDYWVDKFLFQQYNKYKSFVFGYEKDNPSDEYFKTKILEQNSASSDKFPEQTLYTNNLNYAKSFFKKKTENLPKDKLELIFRNLVNSLKFNFYEIDNELDVFIAFETMNNRGKPLSKLELLKNRLIYLTTLLPNEEGDKNKLRAEINEAWKTVYEYLGKNKDNPLDDDEFLKNHWIMYFKYDRKESEVYAKFLLNNYFTAKNVVDSNATIGFDEIKTYVDSISQSIKCWFNIVNPSYSNYNPEVKEWLTKLNRLGFGAFKPMIMAAMVKKVEDEKLLNLLKSSEKFIFLIFSITRKSSNTRNNHFYRLVNDFYFERHKINIDYVIESIELEIEDENYFYYDIDKFESYIEDQYQKGEGFYSWSGLKYFLYEYELYLQSIAKDTVKINWDDFNKRKKENTIEHIYPKTGTKDCWKSNFQKFNENNKKYLLHSLGNLLLLSRSKNSENQNNCFDFKKKHTDKNENSVGFFNGSYSEIQVAQYEKWTADEILEKGCNMLTFMEERWGIEIGDKTDKTELLKLEFLLN